MENYQRSLALPPLESEESTLRALAYNGSTDPYPKRREAGSDT